MIYVDLFSQIAAVLVVFLLAFSQAFYITMAQTVCKIYLSSFNI